MVDIKKLPIKQKNYKYLVLLITIVFLFFLGEVAARKVFVFKVSLNSFGYSVLYELEENYFLYESISRSPDEFIKYHVDNLLLKARRLNIKLNSLGKGNSEKTKICAELYDLKEYILGDAEKKGEMELLRDAVNTIISKRCKD